MYDDILETPSLPKGKEYILSDYIESLSSYKLSVLRSGEGTPSIGGVFLTDRKGETFPFTRGSLKDRVKGSDFDEATKIFLLSFLKENPQSIDIPRIFSNTLGINNGERISWTFTFTSHTGIEDSKYENTTIEPLLVNLWENTFLELGDITEFEQGIFFAGSIDNWDYLKLVNPYLNSKVRVWVQSLEKRVSSKCLNVIYNNALDGDTTSARLLLKKDYKVMIGDNKSTLIDVSFIPNYDQDLERINKKTLINISGSHE